MPKLGFHIFIAGSSLRNEELVRYYRQACQDHLGRHQFELTVTDLTRNAQLAEQHKILATPTIIRSYPLPEKRVIGSLTPEGAVKALQFLLEDLNHTRHEKSQ